MIMDNLICWLMHTIWKWLCRKDYHSFKRASRRVKETQEYVLLNILKANKKTAFGRQYGFQSICHIEDYQQKVPISRYESYVNNIARIKSGEKRVLTLDPIIRIHTTSGSTTAAKEIPWNKMLLRQFQKGIRVWIYDLLHHHKVLLYGRAYWSITPSMGENEEDTENRIPGFGEDLEYFGRLEKYLLKHLLVVPHSVEQIKDTGLFYYLTLLKLVHERNIRLFSVWNPMLLVIMMRKLNALFPLLLGDLKHKSVTFPCEISYSEKTRIIHKLKIKRRRVAELEKVLRVWERNKDQNLPSLIWPKLSVVSCWADGSAAKLLPELQKYFHNVLIQPKGLLATEGVVSVPLTSKNRENAPVLSVTSHFYEFQEVGDDSIESHKALKLAHELKVGQKYKVFITTAGGLYRYNLQDIVMVVGNHGDLPCLRFIGRNDLISDVMGEKLNGAHVEKVLEEVFSKFNILPGFYLLAPEKSGDELYAYTLFVSRGSKKTKYTALIENLELGLRQNFHYDYCRRIEQIGHVKIVVLDQNHGELMDQYIRHKSLGGKKLGDIKHAALDNEIGWSKVFSA